MASNDRDPWASVRTRHDFAADEVISALQKEVRRANTENAALLAYEMITTSGELENRLWHRLMVISVEDVGFGDPQSAVLVHTLYQMCQSIGARAGESWLFALHAVRVLCMAHKDRSSDEMALWIKREVEGGRLVPSIPDYALDMHTGRGQQMGRGFQHFLDEGAKLNPELPDRDMTYLDRVRELLKEGKL